MALLFGSGAAMAESSMDLKRRANCPEAQAAIEIFERNYGANPMQGGYNRVLEFDLIHYKVRQDLPAIQALEWEISQSGLPQEDLRKAAWKGWLYRNAREYHDNGYSYPQYVLEWARKSVWRSGYMPISGRRGKNPSYNVVYSGKYPCPWRIDYINGLPDQKFRHLLEIADQKAPYAVAVIDGMCTKMTEEDLLKWETDKKMEQFLDRRTEGR